MAESTIRVLDLMAEPPRPGVGLEAVVVAVADGGQGDGEASHQRGIIAQL